MKKIFLNRISFLTSLLFTLTLVLPLVTLVNWVNVSAATTSYDVASSSTTPSAVTINNTVLPPSNLAYTLTTPDDIKLTWGSVYGAIGYNIYGITDGQLKLLGTTASTTYAINNLLENSYTYVVSTISADGESGPCAPISVDIVYPSMAAPTTLTNTFQNGNDIVLNWLASQYAQTYNIYIIATDGQKTLVTSVTGRTYTIANVHAGTYTYAVSAVNSLYGESPISNLLQVNVVFPTMKVPSNLTYKIQNGSDVVLTWGTVSYANSYNVYELINGQEVMKTTVYSPSATLSNVQAGDHTYVIHSVSTRFGESTGGSQISLTVVAQTMQAPANLTYSLFNGTDITLKWGTVTYATGYNIYQVVDGQKVLKSTVTGTTVKYTNMVAGSYVYEVHSYSDRFGESPEGSQVSVTLGDVTMAAPSNFAYKINNGNDIVLTWNSEANVTSYKVYAINNGQKTLKSTVTGTTITYVNMPAGDYSYEVHSYSTSLGESAEGSQLSFTLAFPMMQPPANLMQITKNATDFTLSWEASSYATNYKVYQIINGKKVLKSTVTGTSVTYTNMAAGEYNFEVHSYSTRFGESVEGSNLTMTLNEETMQAPADLTYSTANINDFTLKWTAATYATSYKIYQVIDGQNVLKKTVTSPYATFTNMPAGDYDYVVTSVSTILGESPSGAEVSFSLVLPTMVSPGNVAYKIQNGNNVVLTWEAATYATSYKVYELVNGQEVLKSTVSSLTATLTNVAAGDHTYVVHSVSTRFGESLEGSQISFNLQQNYMVAPTGLTYSIVNGNDITLKWTAAPYATSYKIYQVIDGQNVLKKTVTSAYATFTNMPAGDYDYLVTSVSTIFGESPSGAEITFSLDILTMVAPSNLTQSITSGNYITLKWNAVTYATGYKVYQIVGGQKTLVKTVTSTSVSFADMPEGDYTYEVHSYSDRFGESEEGSSVNFTLDWPVVQSPVLKDAIYNVNNITLSWQAVTWANEYRVYEIVDNIRQLIYKGTALSYKIFNLSEDTHEYEVTAYSTRFGESASSNRITETIIYPDMQSPVASLKLVDATSAVISWSFVTYANGYNVYEIIDGKPILLTKNLNNLSYTVTNLSYKDHEYYVTSASNSFGESQPSNTVIAKLIVDTEPPKTVSDAPINWVNQSPVVVNLSATDNETGVANTYYSINDGNFTEGTSITVDKEGENKISFYSVDKVGNKEAVQTTYVKIDKTAPVTTSNAPETWVKEDVTVMLTATDAQSGVSKTFYSIDGSDYLEGTSFIVKDEGIHKIAFYSVDVAGNTESVNTVEVKIDKTAPVVTMDLSNEYKLGTSLPLIYVAKDNLSDIASEKMMVFGPNDTIGNAVENNASIQIDKQGVYKVYVTITDAAGLSTTIEKQFVVYIPATIEVTPTVIKGNKGIFTVRVDVPVEYGTQGFDLSTATLNGVKALTSNNGYYNQAKLGQFKFERSDFNWTPSDMRVEFRDYINGYLVVGETTVKVQK